MMENDKTKARIEMMFKLMEYDNISDRQHDIIISLEESFINYGKLSEKQFDLLANIFKQAAER